MPDQDVISVLRERLRRYPVEKFPIQHATASFHLGIQLARAGQLAEADEALEISARLFDPTKLPVEHAKAINVRGAVLRSMGRQSEAVEAFGRAAELFDVAGLALEQGAALFNLGLVQREREELDAAVATFTQARERFDPKRAPAEAAAAARELGATLLTAGRPAEAREALDAAVRLAREAGDAVGLGGAANVLGLSCLADGDAEAAVDAFREALAQYPRTVRPGEYAMAKANLALAQEAVGAHEAARLAAVQSLGAPGVEPPVRAQAEAVLARLGYEPGVVLAVLDSEPQDRWPLLLREELARWADASPDERRAEASAWIEGMLARQGRVADLAEAWVGGLLELPPEPMTDILRATLEAQSDGDAESAERFRSAVQGAMVRFAMPQWQRLAGVLNQLASELGQEASWS